MNTSKLFLTLGLALNFSVFGTENFQMKNVDKLIESLLNSDKEKFIFSKLGNQLISSQVDLKMIQSQGDANSTFSEFALTFQSLKPSHDYVWFLTKEDGKMIHYFQFKTDEKGQIGVQLDKIEEDKTLLLADVSMGELFLSILFDPANSVYTLDFLTPFPLTYKVGQTGVVRLKTKLPFFIIQADFEGLDPSEKISIQIEDEVEDFVADEFGKASKDLWVTSAYKENSVHIKMTTSSGEQNCLFEMNQESTKNKMQINL